MKYKEIMERIEVDDAMRQRTLERIHKEQKPKTTWFQFSKLAPVVSLAAVLILALVLPTLRMGSSKEASMAAANDAEMASEPVALASAIESTTSIEQLSSLVGFHVNELTELPFAVTSTEYNSYFSSMAEINYIGENQSLTYRKEAGNADPSGIFDEYAAVEEISIDGVTVTVKGDGANLSYAYWNDGSYSYSVSFEKPVEQEVMNTVIQHVIKGNK